MNPMTCLEGDLDLDDPDPKRITYANISWTIAGLPRYNRQVHKDWFVGEHVACCAILACHDYASRGLTFSETTIAAALAALHHDDGEAYYQDIIYPQSKYLGPEYKAMQRRVDLAISKALDLDNSILHNDETKLYDRLMLEAERRYLIEWNPETMGDWRVTAEVGGMDEPLELARYLLTKITNVPAENRVRAAHRRLLAMDKILRAQPKRTAPITILTKLLLVL